MRAFARRRSRLQTRAGVVRLWRAEHRRTTFARHHHGSFAFTSGTVAPLSARIQRVAKPSNGNRAGVRPSRHSFFKTTVDPFSGKLSILRVFSGELVSDSSSVQRYQRREGADRASAQA